MDNSTTNVTVERPWCPDPQRSDLQNLLHFYLIPITVIIGVTLNSICLYIFCKFRELSSATYLLRFICALDTINLLRDVLFPHLGKYVFCIRSYWALTLMYTVTGTLTLLPFWIILLISIDRFGHIWQPLLARRTNTLRLSRIASAAVVVVILIAIFILNVVRFILQYGQRPKVFATTVTLLFGLGPFPFIAILNILVIYRMMNRDFNVQNTIKGTVMILTMTLSFVLLKIPMVILTVVNLFGDQSSLSHTYSSVALYLDTVNFSANFWLYLVSGRSFRKSLKRTFMSLIYWDASWSVSGTSTGSSRSRTKSSSLKPEEIELPLRSLEQANLSA